MPATKYDGRRPRLPVDLGRRVDEVRGQVPFNRWVVQALEAALGRGLSTGEAAADEPVPASPRTPALPPDARKAENPYFAPERKSASYVKPFNPIPKGGKG